MFTAKVMASSLGWGNDKYRSAGVELRFVQLKEKNRH